MYDLTNGPTADRNFPRKLLWLAVIGLGLLVTAAVGARAQSQEVGGQHWNNSGFTLKAEIDSANKTIKLGRPLTFKKSNIGQNLLHGMQFIVSPGQAAQRERMNLYSLQELGKIWPQVREVLNGTDVKATLVTPAAPNKYIGVPVKWNKAFATTMSGAFWGKQEQPASDFPTAVASALIADGIVSGQDLGINESRVATEVTIIGSEPREAFQGLHRSMLKAAIALPQKQGTSNTAYMGFNIELDKAFASYQAKNPEFTASAPPPVTRIISTREMDGSRLAGWHEWVTE